MNERISRLMDGDVDAAEMDGLLVTLKSDAAMATWSCYHTIGDALRGEPAVTRGIGMAVARQLVTEPTVLAPRASPASRTASWAWAAAASVAAATVVGWTAYSLIDATPAGFAKAGEAGGMDLITTAPTVVYQVLTRDGSVVEIENPSKLPDPSKVEEIREPIITATILMPQDYVGPVLTLCTEKRGVQRNMQYVGRQVLLTYELPMAEVVMDFFDKLKSVSRGYASLDYDFKEFRAADVVKLDILINGERVDALSVMVHRSVANYRGREVASKMRSLIPRQMFDVAVQAAIGAQIIARETIKALRKNVLAKCYGGDITRKKKLLEKQKAGKKRMKSVGSVEIPQEAFLAILQVGDK